MSQEHKIFHIGNWPDIKMTRRELINDIAALGVVSLSVGGVVALAKYLGNKENLQLPVEKPKIGELIAWSDHGRERLGIVYSTKLKIDPPRPDLVDSFVLAMDANGEGGVPVDVTGRTEMTPLLKTLGPENITIKQLNDVLTHFHFVKENDKDKYWELDKYYGQAVIAEWYVGLNKSGIPLKELAIQPQDDVFIRFPAEEDSFIPSDESYPRNEIKIKDISEGLTDELNLWLLRVRRGASK